ncbi:MAG: 1-(5-phosphoribosyl)-5-[(5-phosphoribosylamino)methylideneamino]imidazole-4-carboxamide isomerase [Eubacteriaceae bacterium]|nr:1-(5-phosphoribosyl)-5-[(5-phosphoribosylamino)methylideneamino]imidazole-4-carboxamide isomerase [Eubacteriaceae bacterium]
MIVYPAIDLFDGKCVRLTKGDFSTQVVYSADPLAVAASFKEDGATHLHVVDLNAAKGDGSTNGIAIASLASDSGLILQVGGGIRGMDAVDSRADIGVERIVIGTYAVQNEGFLEAAAMRYPNRICLALDCLGGEIMVNGWQAGSGIGVLDFLIQIEGLPIASIIATDIDRDGMLVGTSISLYEQMGAKTSHELIASGGVASEQDLYDVLDLGMGGVIIGKALYEGKLELKRCLEICNSYR